MKVFVVIMVGLFYEVGVVVVMPRLVVIGFGTKIVSVLKKIWKIFLLRFLACNQESHPRFTKF